MSSDRIRRIATESLWIGAGQGFAALAAVVGVKLLTTVMEPASYGIFSLAVISATLLHSCFFGPIGAAAQRYFGPFQEEKRARCLLQVFSRLALRATWICGVLLVVFCGSALMAGAPSLAALFAAAGLFTVFSGYIYLIDGIQNAARNRQLVALHNASFGWFRFLLAYLLVIVWGDHGWLAMSGFALAAILVFASEWWFFSRRIIATVAGEPPAQNDPALQKEIFTFAWPFAAIGIMTWLQQSADRWALQMFRSEADVGLYSSLFQLGYAPIVMLFAMLYHTASPVVFGRAGSGADVDRVRHADRLNYQMAAVFGGVVVILFLLVLGLGQYLQFLVGPKYRGVMGLLPWMVLAGGFFSVAQNLYGYFMIRGKTGLLLVPTLIYSLFGSALVFAAAAYGGLEAVVAARIATSLLYLFFVIILIFRFRRQVQVTADAAANF